MTPKPSKTLKAIALTALGAIVLTVATKAISKAISKPQNETKEDNIAKLRDLPDDWYD